MKKFPFLAVFLFRKCDRPLHSFFLNVKVITFSFSDIYFFFILSGVLKGEAKSWNSFRFNLRICFFAGLLFPLRLPKLTHI